MSKIIIEQLGHNYLAVSDGEKSVTVVESTSALDYHLALNAIRVYGEMLNRHLTKAQEDMKNGK